MTRLFIVHIAVLPALFVLVIAGHLMLVKYHGMAPSPFRRATGPERSEPFTRHLARLGGYGLLLLSALTVLATLFPPGVGHAPVAGIEVTKPAWPMLWVYPIEDAVGIKGASSGPRSQSSPCCYWCRSWIAGLSVHCESGSR